MSRHSDEPRDSNDQHSEGPSLYSRLSVPGAAATNNKRWVSVDALRAIAALMVLASHAHLLSPNPAEGASRFFPRLGVGVWIFFAASGYLIAGPFLRAVLDGRPAPAVRRYALRRAVRILPAYWVALAVILVVGGSTIRHWWQLPVHALLAQGLVPGELKSIYLVAWSLAVEAIFYVLVPIGAWLAWRAASRKPVALHRLATGVVALWITAFAMSLLLAVAFPFGANQALPAGVQVLALVGSLANFCPGMLVFLAVAATEAAPSRWSRRYVAVASRPAPTLAVAAAMLVIATELHSETSNVATAVQGPLFGLASGLVLATFVYGRVPRPVAQLLAPVGLTSYGVYLWHWVILSTVLRHGLPLLTGSDAGTVVNVERVGMLVALTLPVAALSWLVVERPLLRRSSDWERRSRVAAGKARADVQADAGPLPAAGHSPVPASSGS